VGLDIRSLEKVAIKKMNLRIITKKILLLK